MIPKKLCSIGILDININLVLRKTESEYNNFNINDYNTVEDLENLFFPKEEENNAKIDSNKNDKNETDLNKININYFDYITLSSDNNLINTLLYINRAYKTKTFIEFIILNKMEFSYSTKFVKKFLQKIFDKNYFFIIENKILDIPSKIKFTIKILNDDNDEIISSKSFELFEINEIDFDQKEMEMDLLNDEENKNDIKYNNILTLEKINYNFENANYFLLDMNIINELKLPNNKDISLFIYEIIKKYPNIKIILIINKNINNFEQNDLMFNKQLIELSDIIFGFQSHLNNFFNLYNSTIKSNIREIKYDYYNIYNNNENNKNKTQTIAIKKPRKNDLIADDKDKCRKNIPRITIIFEEFKYVTIYIQKDIHMCVDYIETFILRTKNIKNENKIEYLNSNQNKMAHIFIAGFLSRIIHNKSLRVCVCAGDLLIKKTIKIFMKNIDYISNINDFNILVPSKKKSSKAKLNEKILKESYNLFLKENRFVLDCTNVLKSQKKEYNSLLDKNCLNYLLKYQNIKHLKEIGFINKNGILLKDPDNLRKKEIRINKPNNLILTDNNNILKYNKTNYNTIVSYNYYKNLLLKKPKFMSVFSPTSDHKNYNNTTTSFKKNQVNSLPKMSKTSYYFTKKDKNEKICKNFKFTDLNQKKIKKNSYDLVKIERNKSFFNSNGFNYQNYLYHIKKLKFQNKNNLLDIK